MTPLDQAKVFDNCLLFIGRKSLINENLTKKSSRQSLFGITAKEALIDETKELALKAKIKLDKIALEDSPNRLDKEPSHILGFQRSNTPLLYKNSGFYTPKETSRFGEMSQNEPTVED